jgi:putative ABC transport system ATP-binding protein
MIELRKVTKEFNPTLATHARTRTLGLAHPKRRVTALNEVSLRIGKGEICSVVGPSGSGKSTMLNLIGGLDRPTSGEILIDDQAMSKMTDHELTLLRRDKIGFVFQFFNLLPTLSSLENITLPLHLRGWSRAKASERGYELLELVGLGERTEHLPDELSGGERQRIAIARALSVYPPILLGDEPTGNLDTATGAEILKLLQNLHARLGTTVVIVTHDKNVAESCPRTVRMRDGKVEEDVLR